MPGCRARLRSTDLEPHKVNPREVASEGKSSKMEVRPGLQTQHPNWGKGASLIRPSTA